MVTYRSNDLVYIIRDLCGPDIENGYLETLESLAIVGVSKSQACQILLRMINSGSHVFVAVSSDRVIGAITLLVEQKIIHGGGLVGHIEDVAVHKDFQRHGVGKSLVKHALNQAKIAGCYKAILDCNESIADFYIKSGFRKHEVAMRIDL